MVAVVRIQGVTVIFGAIGGIFKLCIKKIDISACVCVCFFLFQQRE